MIKTHDSLSRQTAVPVDKGSINKSLINNPGYFSLLIQLSVLLKDRYDTDRHTSKSHTFVIFPFDYHGRVSSRT